MSEQHKSADERADSSPPSRVSLCLQWSREAEREGDAECAGMWRGLAVVAAEKEAKS